MQEMIEQEIFMSRPVFNIVPNLPGRNEKNPIIIKLDMQWPKRGSGHSNASLVGIIHCFGALIDGIIETDILRNFCII